MKHKSTVSKIKLIIGNTSVTQIFATYYDLLCELFFNRRLVYIKNIQL